MSINGNHMSSHILPTSSNLLGLCFVILSFIKLSKLSDQTIIDEMCAVAIVLFLTSSMLSYMSIRSAHRSDLFEKTADIIFLVGLSLLAVIGLVIAFEITH